MSKITYKDMNRNKRYRYTLNAMSVVIGALTAICGLSFLTAPMTTLFVIFALTTVSNFVGLQVYKHYNSLPPAAPDQFLLEGEREVELFLGNVSQDEINNEQGLKRLTPPRFIRG